MHVLVGTQWVAASPQIVATADGAAATNTAHSVFLSGNANSSAALRLLTPDGKTLSSHVLCLSYFDSATGTNVLLASLQDSTGQLLAGAQDSVLYTKIGRAHV